MGLFDIFKNKSTRIKKNNIFDKGELANIFKNNGINAIEEGAENGNLQCQQLLYSLYMIGAKGDNTDMDKYKYYTRLAAHQNDSTAQLNHAKNIYDSIEEIKSENIEKNGGVLNEFIPEIQRKLKESLYWYRRSYENGNIEGLKRANDIEFILKDWIEPLMNQHLE